MNDRKTEDLMPPASVRDTPFCVSFGMDTGGDAFDGPSEGVAHFKAFDALLLFEGIPIGKLTGTLVRGDLIVADGYELTTRLDEMSEELASIASHLFDDAVVADYVPAVRELTQAKGFDILYLARMTVEPEFLGHRFGLALAQQVLRGIPHDLAVMKPFPLQHEANRMVDTNMLYREIGLTQATEKLRKHYGRLGFKQLDGSPLMVRGPVEKFVDVGSPSDADIETLRKAARAAVVRYFRGLENAPLGDMDRELFVVGSRAISESRWSVANGLFRIMKEKARDVNSSRREMAPTTAITTTNQAITPTEQDCDEDELTVDFELGPQHRRDLFERPTDNEGAYHDHVKATLYLGDRAIAEVTGTLLRGGLIVNDRLHLFQAMDNISHEMLRAAEAVIDIDHNHYADSFSDLGFFRRSCGLRRPLREANREVLEGRMGWS